MTIWDQLRSYFQRVHMRRRRRRSDHQLLREFVYLDDVSVYSLLASRRGSIVSEFTEGRTTTAGGSVGGSISLGLGVAKGKMDASAQEGHAQSSQVLSKAIIQTHFKELHDLERGSLLLRPPACDRAPRVRNIGDLEEGLPALAEAGWLVDAAAIRRGKLLEVDVELEADPIFRMASVIATIREIMEDNAHLFGTTSTAQIDQMRSMTKLLESLLVGLVPIRGRLVDYVSAEIDGREYLIHKRLCEAMSVESTLIAAPAVVVGVAQRDLFWKDIRRILFSGARYTVFCRLATTGVTERWNPVKVADVLAGIAPQFDEAITEFGQTALRAMTEGAAASTTSTGDVAVVGVNLLTEYVQVLTSHHKRKPDSGAIRSVVQNVPTKRDWWKNVDGWRPVFAEATRRVDDALGVQTPPDVASDLRMEIMRKMRQRHSLISNASSEPLEGRASLAHRQERFLDAEIIAVYW